ncbi:MAG: purine-nucleoside phosphorylase [Chloroflexi bacterium]|nr:MAG: purine-nucleoside phosphorylase [Chloroflexota bacterium]RLC78487.1 MAG: purine-nucleoside phosphorylase [Chloroflexota bacterium]
MPEFFSRSHFETAAATIQERIQLQPQIGLILGSGLGPLADSIEDSVYIPYDDVPHFPTATVEGHTGRLVVGRLEGQAVMVMQGRAHYYEGYSMAEVTFPVRVMHVMGVETLIVTNAAGGLNPEFQAGDVMLINDHINLIGMAGLNPLRGPNLDEFGPRFPDMSEVYDVHLRELARRAADEAKVPLREGVYICLAGPSFETPADLRFLRAIGVDAVGMSTVPEATVARHGGARVLGLSGISNVAAVEGAPAVEATHEEVLEAGQVLAPRLEAILRGVLRTL